MSCVCVLCYSHFDAVTSVAFHPVEAMLLTGSEDKTLKLWNLQRNGQARRFVELSRLLECVVDLFFLLELP